MLQAKINLSMPGCMMIYDHSWVRMLAMFCLSLTSCVELKPSQIPYGLCGCMLRAAEAVCWISEYNFLLEGKFCKRKCETLQSCVALSKYNISQREIGLSRRCEKASQSQNFIWPGFFTSHELPKEGTSAHIPDTPANVATGILTDT